jgi:hypothetical protein
VSPLNRRTAARAALSLAIVITACGDDGDDGDKPVAGPAAPADFCAAYAAAVCEGTGPCDCVDDFEGPCDVKVRASCERGLASRLGGIVLGSIAYVPEAATACVEGVRVHASTCGAPTEAARPLLCAEILRDTAALGESCSQIGLGMRCALGAGFCHPETRLCTALVADGPCLGTIACVDTHMCEGGTCLPRLDSGDACVNDARCAAGLVCGEDAVCGAPGPAGTTCQRSEQCGAGLACIAGACAAAAPIGAECRLDECGGEAYCEVGDTRVCQPLGRDGEVCNFNDTDCEAGLICDYMRQPLARCAPIPVIGEACPTGRCVEGAVCAQPEQTCVKAPELGEPCNPDLMVPCATGLGCASDSRTCVAAGAEGEACVGGGLICAAGLKCKPVGGSGVGVPTCARPGGAGTDCGSEDALCTTGFYCDWNTGKCVASLGDGGNCDRDAVCGEGFWCDYRESPSICRPTPVTEGEACGVSCGGGLRCELAPGSCERDACLLRQ